MTGIHMMDLLVNTLGECHESFNESALFTNNNKNLLSEIQDNFFNISRLFDCISCDKCRLNGKVQIEGLGTALKIIFTNSRDLKSLKKTELIAFIHLLNKLSESLKMHKDFLEMEKDQEFKSKAYKHGGAYILIVMNMALFKLLENNVAKENKVKEKESVGSINGKQKGKPKKSRVEKNIDSKKKKNKSKEE